MYQEDKSSSQTAAVFLESVLKNIASDVLVEQLVIGGSLVRFPWAALGSVLEHQCVNELLYVALDRRVGYLRSFEVIFLSFVNQMNV